jgi:hypothetical protein
MSVLPSTGVVIELNGIGVIVELKYLHSFIEKSCTPTKL